MSDTIAKVRAMRATWTRDLLQSVLPFWLRNSIDSKHGGYFTCLDEDGTVLDDTKYHWLQGREVWTWSRMYNNLVGVVDSAAPEFSATETTREEWWDAAACGARFLDNARRDSDGLFNFSSTRDGSAGLHFQRRPYTAVFYILGNLEFAEAIKTRQKEGKSAGEFNAEDFQEKAVTVFELFRKWLADPTLLGRLPPPPGAKPVSVLAEVMCLAGLSEEFIYKMPEKKESFMVYVKDAMARVETHFDKERCILMEHADPETGVTHSTMSGRLFNPGHSIEVAWFLLHLCKLSPDKHLQSVALSAIEGSLKLGWDTEEYGGGIVYMMDILGKPLLDTTVTATNKLWWPHCEALYACSLAFSLTLDDKWVSWLEKIHEYIYTHFCDQERGEWCRESDSPHCS